MKYNMSTSCFDTKKDMGEDLMKHDFRRQFFNEYFTHRPYQLDLFSRPN